jgi:hypothetical protein
LRAIQKQRKAEYCDRITQDLLHNIAGYPDASDEQRLAFHLVSNDPTALIRYNETAIQMSAVGIRKDRQAEQEEKAAA